MVGREKVGEEGARAYCPHNYVTVTVTCSYLLRAGKCLVALFRKSFVRLHRSRRDIPTAFEAKVYDPGSNWTRLVSLPSPVGPETLPPDAFGAGSRKEIPRDLVLTPAPPAYKTRNVHKRRMFFYYSLAAFFALLVMRKSSVLPALELIAHFAFSPFPSSIIATYSLMNPRIAYPDIIDDLLGTRGAHDSVFHLPLTPRALRARAHALAADIRALAHVHAPGDVQRPGPGRHVLASLRH